MPYEEKMEFVLHTHAHTQTHTLTHNHMKLTQSLLPPDIQQRFKKNINQMNGKLNYVPQRSVA